MTTLRFSTFLTPFLLFSLISVTPALSQEEGGGNLLKNGNFEEKTTAVDSLLDGVNSANELQLETLSVQVVGTDRRLSSSNVPPGVALVDLNQDGKVDIVAASTYGIFYVFFNESSNPAQPKFTNAEILPIFLSLSRENRGVLNHGIQYERRAPRFSFHSWTGSGSLDMTIGNLYGELFLIPGNNNESRVEYRQPRDYAAAQIVTSSIEGRLWGNLFAPVVADFVKGGGPEIILGEGSYSANSIFLLYSESAVMPPRFSEANRSFLVVGEGREQLVPAVVDVNGDGLLDVLVADKVGKITVHLQPEGWKPQDGALNMQENANTSVLSIGGQEQLNTAITIATGDYNGDGLFDLLIGQANGKVGIAVNTGSQGEPKFAKLEPIKGEDKWGKDTLTNVPGWDTHNDRVDGSPLTYWRVETRGSGEGEIVNHVLKAGNFPNPNKIVSGNLVPNLAGEDIWVRADQRFDFKNGERYKIELEWKGSGVTDVSLWYFGTVSGQNLGRVTQDERGGVSADQRNAREWLQQDIGTLSATPNWQSRSFTFTPKNKDRRLDDLETLGLRVGIRAKMNRPDAELFIDNVRMTRE